MNQIVNKDIDVLTDYEHILKRPNMYIGPVDPFEDKIPIIENNLIIKKNKTFSIGMYRLFEEVIDNAIDEAKRCYHLKTPMKKIIVNVNSKTNMIAVTDTGQGFKNGTHINKKSGLTNIETALTHLRAGSNFHNEDSEISLIGTNGVGVSCVNVLSEEFEVITKNNDTTYNQIWKNFEVSHKNTINENNKETGTTIKFIPRVEVFKKQKWDKNILTTKLKFASFLIKQDFTLKNLELEFYWNNKKIDITESFIPDENLSWRTGNTVIYLWKSASDDMSSVSFVNGSLCTGIHQKIVTDYINNTLFQGHPANKFYNTLILTNLPPKYVKFDSQTKVRLVTPKEDILKIMKFHPSKSEIKSIQKSELYNSIIKNILELMQKEELKDFKKARKSSKTKVISDKFYNSEKKENLFICEGNSALGSILQRRDPKTDAFYALRGKIKNAKVLSDLSANNEIVDLINILNLNIEDKGSKCSYQRIIIATDQDPDGHHIATLIINFFANWFPKIIEDGRLFILRTPLISVDKGKQRKYFYSIDEFKNEPGTVRYLKGLGSLSIQDWEHVFNNMELMKIKNDAQSSKFLNIIFGKDTLMRKKWLTK